VPPALPWRNVEIQSDKEAGDKTDQQQPLSGGEFVIGRGGEQTQSDAHECGMNLCPGREHVGEDVCDCHNVRLRKNKMPVNDQNSGGGGLRIFLRSPRLFLPSTRFLREERGTRVRIRGLGLWRFFSSALRNRVRAIALFRC